MPGHAPTFAYGTLEAHGDTWFLRTCDSLMLVNVPVLFDSAFTNQTVSILGRMGVSSDACLTPLLIAERIVTHEVIAHRAYEISRSAPGGSAEDHWWRAERELLGRDRLQ